MRSCFLVHFQIDPKVAVPVRQTIQSQPKVCNNLLKVDGLLCFLTPGSILNLLFNHCSSLRLLFNPRGILTVLFHAEHSHFFTSRIIYVLHCICLRCPCFSTAWLYLRTNRSVFLPVYLFAFVWVFVLSKWPALY